LMIERRPTLRLGEPRWVVIQTASLQAISLKTMRNSSSSKFETLNLGRNIPKGARHAERGSCLSDGLVVGEEAGSRNSSRRGGGGPPPRRGDKTGPADKAPAGPSTRPSGLILPLPKLPLEGRVAKIPEGLVTPSYRFLETLISRESLERVPFPGMTRYPVENDS